MKRKINLSVFAFMILLFHSCAKFDDSINLIYPDEESNYWPGGAGMGGGCDQVWGIGGSNHVFKWNPSNNSWYEPNPAARLSGISAGYGTVWGISNDHVFRWNPNVNAWDEPNPAARLIMVRAFTNNIAYGMTSNWQLWRTINGGIGWSVFPNNGIHFSEWGVDFYGNIWGIDITTNRVYKSDYYGNWTEPNQNARLWKINPGNEIWGVGYRPNSSTPGRVYRWNFSTNSWDEPNPAARLADVYGTRGCVTWGMTCDSRLWKWNGSSWYEPNPAARLVKMTIGN